MSEYDVIVVGAGPTGLTLAIDLGQRGVRTLLVERDADTKQFPKMDRSNARTMELYRRLGFADAVRELGYPADAPMDVFITTTLADPPLVKLCYPSVAEHRAKIAATLDASEPLEPYQLVSQNDLEPFLKTVAEATPHVTVRFGCALVAFDQDDDGVTVELAPADGDHETVRTRFLVGCDGASSTVRKALGINLEGQGNLVQLRQIGFHSEDLYDRIPMGRGRHYYLADPDRGTFVVQGSRKDFTLNAGLSESRDVVQAVREKVGFDFDYKITTVTNWKLHLLLAERYRDRRVLLAGDSVHLVIPTGGLGMNTGVGDAVDLAWKLAGTVQGWGGPGLLDSYEPERRRVGARNVSASGWASEGMGLWRQLVTPEISLDSPEGAAVRKAVGEAANVHHRRVHEMVGVELGYSYAGLNLVAYEPDNSADWETTKYTPHTRPGIRIPHVWLADGRAMQDVLGPNYTLVDLTGNCDTTSLEKAFANWSAPLDVLHSEESHVQDIYQCSLILVRPDLHIFWRGDSLPADIDGLAEAALGRTNLPFRSELAMAGTDVSESTA